MTEEEEFEFRLRYEQEQGQAKPAKTAAQPEPASPIHRAANSVADNVVGYLKGNRDLVGGMVRGAGSLGATILAPLDYAEDALWRAQGVDRGNTNDQRRSGMGGGLRELGVDTDSLLYQGGKLGTEVAGTAGTGGVIARGLAMIPRLASKAPAVIDAIRTAGMSAGGKTGLASLPARMTGGAVAGGGAAALVNPEDAAVGAGVGAALPPVLMAAGKVGQAVGPVLFKKSAGTAAVRKVAETLGDKSQQAIGDIQTYYPKGAEDIPLSAAGVTKNFDLAQLEQGSRLRAPGQWAEFDQRQGKAVFDNVLQATQEADDLAARAAQRSQNWADNWARASAAQKPRIWQQRMGQLGGDIEQALASPEASNPAVRNVLEAVRNEVVRVGPSFSPGHLQQLRANLNGKVNPMSPDVFKSAPRDNPAVISMMKEMDDILNAATGGKWDAVRQGYAADSTKVHQSKAAQKVRNAFLDADTGRIRGTAADADGDVARVTPAGLGRAMDAARLPDKTLALSPDADARLNATLDALRRQGIVQNVKRSATAGGGSDTVSNAVSLGTSNAPSWMLQALNFGRQIAGGRTDQEMARLLSDPDSLAAALTQFSRPSRPGQLALSASRSLPILTGQGEGP